jgi:hypothetical protein
MILTACRIWSDFVGDGNNIMKQDRLNLKFGTMLRQRPVLFINLEI